MQDAELTALMGAAMRLAFPAVCRGVNIGGVELVLLDADVYGVAGHYNWNRRRLSAEHRTLLQQRVADFDRIRDELPDDQARAYFDAYRRAATHLLADSARQQG